MINKTIHKWRWMYIINTESQTYQLESDNYYIAQVYNGVKHEEDTSIYHWQIAVKYDEKLN